MMPMVLTNCVELLPRFISCADEICKEAKGKTKLMVMFVWQGVAVIGDTRRRRMMGSDDGAQDKGQGQGLP
jgi:hypothetical protein